MVLCTGTPGYLADLLQGERQNHLLQEERQNQLFGRMLCLKRDGDFTIGPIYSHFKRPGFAVLRPVGTVLATVARVQRYDLICAQYFRLPRKPSTIAVSAHSMQASSIVINLSPCTDLSTGSCQLQRTEQKVIKREYDGCGSERI